MAGLPSGNRRPSKPDGLLTVLAEAPGRKMRLREIRLELISRGWMGIGAAERHALEVAAATLAKRGEVDRVSRGIYRLHVPTEDHAS
jgi:hypothetical protein